MDQQRESKVNGEKVNSSKQNLFLGALRTKQREKIGMSREETNKIHCCRLRVK